MAACEKISHSALGRMAGSMDEIAAQFGESTRLNASEESLCLKYEDQLTRALPALQQ